MKVKLIDYIGNDSSIVNVARVSLAKQASNFTDEQNHHLINYLVKYKHEIPFAHTSITLCMKAPISIRTQCFKYKIAFVENEVSRRYVSETPELFVPKFREAPKGNVKQGSGEVIPSIDGPDWERLDQAFLQEFYRVNAKACIDAYNYMIERGVSPEQARFVLPQGVMTEWVWTGSLLAYARFYNLRTDAHAQKEIQDLAKMVGEIIEPLYPHSWEALTGVKQ